MADDRMTLRVSPVLREAIRERAEASGLSESAWVRSALGASIAGGDPPGDAARNGEPPRVADRDETLELLTRAARRGDVTAMKALLAASAPAKVPVAAEPVKPRDPLDELAARRRRGG